MRLAGVTNMADANRFLKETFLPQFNARFAVKPSEPGTAFVAFAGSLKDILCSQVERTVGNDNTLRYKNMVLQIPEDRHRHHYVKAKVQVHHYPDGTMAIFHGPRQLAVFDENGKPMEDKDKLAA